jgi:hypothetical protein
VFLAQAIDLRDAQIQEGQQMDIVKSTAVDWVGMLLVIWLGYQADVWYRA